jgi:hypothetical protein
VLGALGLIVSACGKEPAKSITGQSDEGVPVNQWYMRTQDVDGSQLAHYILEYGVEV